MAVTAIPYDLSILPMDAAVIPLPIELTTPPVTIIYFDSRTLSLNYFYYHLILNVELLI
jgi:hypothetical protein